MDILRVGNGSEFTTVEQVSPLIKSGTHVQIAPGMHANDICGFRGDDVTIECVGGMAQFPQTAPEGKKFPRSFPFSVKGFHRPFQGMQAKGAFVFQGQRARFIGLEISGAATQDGNAAGIMGLDGSSLSTLRCKLHHNQDGIRTGAIDPAKNSYVWIEDTELYANGDQPGLALGIKPGRAHNVYVGRQALCVLKNSISRDAFVGHDFKSRARVNIVFGSQLVDGDAPKSASAQIDVSGGVLAVVRNQLRKGVGASSTTQMIHYYLNRPNRSAAETATGLLDSDGPRELYIEDNQMESHVAKKCAFVNAEDNPSDGSTGKTVGTIAGNDCFYLRETAPFVASGVTIAGDNNVRLWEPGAAMARRPSRFDGFDLTLESVPQFLALLRGRAAAV